MNTKTFVGKTFFTVLLMLFVPWSYQALYTLIYVIGYFIDPAMSDWVEHNYYTFDILFCLVAMLVYLPWYRRLRRTEERIDEYERERPALGIGMFLKATVIAFGLGGLSQWWLIGVSELLSEGNVLGMGESLESFNHAWSAYEEEPYLRMLLSVGIFGPVVEELIFRGIQFSLAERIRRGWFPILLTSFAFGIWHGEPVQVVYTAITGVGIGIVMAYTRNLWVPVYMHILNNIFSSLPPSWETEGVTMTFTLLRLACILPALILLIRMARNLPRPAPSRTKVLLDEPAVDLE